MKVDTRAFGLIFSFLIFGLVSACSELHEADGSASMVPTPRVSPPSYVPEWTPDPEPTPSPIPQPAVEGYFKFGVNGYYGNNLGEYCQFISFAQWTKTGGPEDISAVPELVVIPSSMTFKGICAYRGFFASNGIGYYGNDQGHYCYFESYDQWLFKGGPSDPALVEQFDAIAPTMVSDGICAPVIPMGFFRFGDAGYYANEQGEYCRFVSFPQWKKAGGPEEVTSVVELQRIPTVMKDHGNCAYREFFSSNGIGYYGNDQGHYCRFETYDQWLAKGGPSDPASVEQFATIPTSMIDDGVCQ